MLKSKKYIGVYKRILKNGDVSFVVTFTIAGKVYKRNVGKKSEGMCESEAFLKRIQLMTEYPQGTVTKNAKIKKIKKIKNSTLNSLAEEYFSAREIHSRSIPTIKKLYHYRIGELGEKKLSEICSKDIEQFQKKLFSSGLKNNTINLATELLSTIFTWGIDRNYYDGRNPAKCVHFLQANSERRRFLSESEISELLNHLKKDKQLYIFAMLGLCTGARISSLYKITKKDINFATGQVNLIDVKNNSHYTSYITNQIIKCELETYTEDLRDSDLIFKIKQRTLQKKLQKILNSLFNANVIDSLDKVVIHTLRHTFASNLAMGGTALLTIKKLMNHASVSSTERYVKLSQNSLHEALKRLNLPF